MAQIEEFSPLLFLLLRPKVAGRTEHLMTKGTQGSPWARKRDSGSTWFLNRESLRTGRVLRPVQRKNRKKMQEALCLLLPCCLLATTPMLKLSEVPSVAHVLKSIKLPLLCVRNSRPHIDLILHTTSLYKIVAESN